MGEKTKDLGRFTLKDTVVTVELNNPVYERSSPIVHIQTPTARLECSLDDFFALAGAVLVAEKNLQFIKGLE